MGESPSDMLCPSDPQSNGGIRKNNPVARSLGQNIVKELQLLCHWAKDPPDQNEWHKFYLLLIDLVFDHHQEKAEVSAFARTLIRQIDSLWVFSEFSGLEFTSNHAKRMLRFGVLWRKRNKGTQSEKGNRWVERILSFRQTCQMAWLVSFPLPVDAIDAYFKELKLNLSWLD